jgi:hypothetical protein
MANPRKYTKEFIVQALLILQRNDFNVNKTAKELHLQQVTLRNWKNRYGKDVFTELSSDDKLINPSERKKVISTIKEEILSREKIFLDKVLTIRDIAIERAEQLIVDEKDLNKVANILRIMQELLTGEHIKSLEERNQHISFFQNIVSKQIITNNNLIQYERDKEQGSITQGD